MNKRLKSPTSAQIEVTGNCTSECLHCYNFWREKNGGFAQRISNGMLSESDSATILQKLAAAEVFSITITGGEPLLNIPTTMACIKFARSMKMGVGLNSNLTLLTKNSAVKLQQAGLNSVLTSILGPSAEIHDSITQRPGSFNRLLDGIRVARDAGIRVATNMVVSKLNHGQVRETARVVATLGITSFMATKVGCPGNCSDFSHLELEPTQVTDVFNDLCWAHKELDLKVDTLEPVPLCALQGVDDLNLFISRGCMAGITTICIGYDGTVRPCPCLDVSYGNLITENLDSVWARMDPWSQNAYVPSGCRACTLRILCRAGCRMSAKTSTGRLDGLDPYTNIVMVPNVVEKIKSLFTPRPISDIHAFKTADFRLRREEFGGVVVAGLSQMFLDLKGYEVLSQMTPNTHYDLSRAEIDWKGLDVKKFISRLADGHMVDLT